MAIIKGGTTGALTEVGSASKGARIVSPGGSDAEGGGAYIVRATTGVLAAALAVDAPIFGIRNGPTTNTKVVYITNIAIDFDTMVVFAAQQQFGFYLDRFSAANLAGGTAQTPIKVRTGDPNSACLTGGAEGGDIRMSTTAALTSAGVTFTATPVPIIGWTDPAANKKTSGLRFDFDNANDEPIRLLSGEGCVSVI